jgi:hypothetical protein
LRRRFYRTLSSVETAQPQPRAQKLLWVDRLAADAGLVVQMRASGGTVRPSMRAVSAVMTGSNLLA